LLYIESLEIDDHVLDKIEGKLYRKSIGGK